MSGYRPEDLRGDREYQQELEQRFGFRRMHGLPSAGRPSQGSAQSQEAAVVAALVRARPDDYSHLTTKYVDPGATAQYYAAARQPVTTTPYAQVASNPYATIHEPPSARAVYGVTSQPAASPLADSYGVSHHQKKQQAIQQAVAANYAASYGGPPTTASGSAVLDQRYATPYGITAATPSAYHGEGPPYSAQAAQEIAIMQEAFRNERAASMKRQGYHPSSSRGTTTTAVAVAAALTTPAKHKPSKIKPPPPGRTPSSSSSTPRGASHPPLPPTSSRSKSPSSHTSSSMSADEHSGVDDEDSDLAPPPSSKKKETAVMGTDKDGKPIVEDHGHIWYMGSVPLGVDDDKYWLSELQVFLRANFAEAFAATEEDIAAPMHGRNKPIALGQVGIRCMHCKNDNPAERGQQATSYPSLISGIYNSVQQMLRLHLDCCLSMPPEVRQKIEQLKLSCSSRGGRKQYWVDSAKRLGLVDTPQGIHFVRDPSGPLPPLTGPSVNSNVHRKKKAAVKEKKKLPPPPPPKPVEPEPEPEKPPPPPPIDSRPLVFPEDKPLISDYLYLTLEQMAATTLMEADRVGCYKTRRVGFPGLACRHCVGQAGCGRYFPASEASLSQTTTSQTIMNHVRNCRRCPIEIRENLEIMKRNRMGPEGKRSDKPKHGGRKIFFHRLWARIQGLPIEEEKLDIEEPTSRKKKKKGVKKRASREGSDAEDSDLEEEESGSSSGHDSDTETDEDVESVTSAGQAKGKRKASKKGASPWFDGCVRLTKTDDPHWLSEMECFARSELVEVFCLTNKDDLEGVSGRKEPEIGQVGIRCVFCKALDPSERSNGCVVFPDALSSIHTKIADMIRLHFPSCPAMSEEARQTFKSLRGFDAKTAGDDSSQYWVDAARDIGLANIPPEGARGEGAAWGITFRRDPLQPSPADELDLENAGEQTPSLGKNLLVRAEDRGLCTDQVMLLLRQVRPCLFKNSDRRAGPGSRGRDRVMGFPGLCCMHCTGRNTLGRYFPVSAKNLTDSTANSLQAHIASCTRCPEPIKASLAYLGHRSILQKAELSGSWKKTFFQKVWARLHVDREWKSVDDENDDDNGGYSSAEEQQGNDVADPPIEDESKEDGGDGGSDSEKEELGDHMNVLVKAAAIWLTEQDATTESTKAAARANKAAARNVPATKRPAAAAAAARGGRSAGTATLPTKRRRTHF